MTLEETIYHAQKGKSEAFTTLYNLFCRKWFTICLRYNNRKVDAEDVLQNALTKIFDKIKQFDPQKGDFEGWAYRIVVNENLLFYKKKKAVILYEEVPERAYPDEKDTKYESLHAKQLVDLIQKLPDGYRTVFNMYVVEGYTHLEISEILEISVGASKSQLSKAKRELRKKIKLILNVNH